MKTSFMEKLRKVPLAAWLWGPGHIFFEYSLYLLAAVISTAIGTRAIAWCPKIPLLDDGIPFVPFFSIIYLVSFFFWGCAPVAVSLTGKKRFFNYMAGLLASYVIGFLFFTFLPSYMDREAEGLLVLAEESGFYKPFLSFIYYNDGGARAFDLFPSYHCVISVYSYLGVHRRSEISPAYRAYSLVMAIAICASTLFVKQHYFVDLLGGIALAFICYFGFEKLDLAKRWHVA